jgi:flagellar assembly factor FliW
VMSPKREKNSPESSSPTLKTGHFGSIRVAEDQIITVRPGLLGFPHQHRYILIQHAQESPFLWLQSLDEPTLAFVVLDPAHLIPDYQPAPLDLLLKQVQAQSPQDLKILVILTIPPGRPQDMTANLMGPLVINLKTRQGKQLVLERSPYSHQHRVIPG